MNPDYAALSASDGSGEPVRATVQSPGRSIGSTTIPVQATTNWPTGTFIATTGTLLSSGKLDPTTVQVFYGTASGTDITITAFAAGYSDVGNAAGDVVVIKPTTEWANVVAKGIVGTTQFPANFTNFVETSGGVWSAGSGLVGSGTAGFVWYNGARSAMAAVTNHTFTASKDTYIDYNPTSATWTYLPETNGAAEPAVSTGSVRVAKVVTGSSAISSVIQTPYNTNVSSSTLYNPCKFSVYLTNSQNVGVPNTKVGFDTKNFDTGSNVDVVTNKGRFTAPIAGFYQFNTNFSTTSAGTGNNVALYLFKNGSAIAELGFYVAASGNSPGGGGSALLQLAQGDYVEVYIASGNAAKTLDVSGAWTNTFSGHLVSAK